MLCIPFFWAPPPFSSAFSSPLLTMDPLLSPTEAMVHTLGPSFIERTLSIEEFLREVLAREVFDEPLTDYDYTDAEENGAEPQVRKASSNDFHPVSPPTSVDANPPNQPHALSRKEKGKKRSARRRRTKHEAVQEAEGTDLKAVTKKRRTEAMKSGLLLNFSMRTILSVTRPGWIGRRVDDLPRRVFTKEELVKCYGLVAFRWDGRYASAPPFLSGSC